MKATTDFPPHCVTRFDMRVRFFETDLMGIVHHANYLTFVEAGRVDYRRPARFDDALAIETRLGALTRVTVRFDYRVLRDEELLATGHTVLACVDGAHKPRRIPEDVVAMLLTDEK